MEKQLKTILIGQFNHENYVTTLTFVMNKPGNTELLSGLVITQKLIENNEVKNYNTNDENPSNELSYYRLKQLNIYSYRLKKNNN